MDVRDAVDGRGLKLKQSQEIFCSINETCFTQKKWDPGILDPEEHL